MPRKIAVILAGAVAKGAFEAGALEVLAGADAQVVRIVAASSGALNGVAYAAAVRGRRERDGAAELAALWRDRATWADVVHVDWRELLHKSAISDLSRVRALLRDGVTRVKLADPGEIDLRIVVSPLDGRDGDIGGRPATTYEGMLAFDGAAFDDDARFEDVITAACASASFPFVFAPTEVPGLGRCIDGGAVNNTPIGWAIDDALGRTLDAVLVIAPVVEHLVTPRGELHGAELLGHLIDMLINERLYRDLREGEQRNAALRALAALPAQSAILDALGWTGARPIDLIQIRPLEPLPGSAFSAFRDRDQRAAYLDAGATRARAVLGELGWLTRS
jgi:NTE family protein